MMKKMSSTRTIVLIICMLMVAILLVHCSKNNNSGAVNSASAKTANAAEKTVLLKVPICFSTKLPGLGSTVQWIADRIETASNGSVKMKVYEPGKLVAPFEILESVSKNKVNAGYSMAGYWQGKIPASALFTAVPFGPEAGEYLAWLWYGNGMKLYQEMYDKYNYNVKVLVAGIIAPETSGWFRKPIESPDDLKGLKMRFFGLGGKVMKNLGVAVNLLPGGEIFPALEKNAIDATEYSMPAIDERLGFYKVVKYNYYPGWHQQSSILELLINKDVWNKMTDQQKMVIEMMCKAATADSFAYTEAIQGKAIRENEEKRGVKNVYWSEAMLDSFKKEWEKVAAEQSAQDPFFKKVYDDMKQFRENYTYWKKRGFLPR